MNPTPPSQSIGEMLEEVIDLVTGLTVFALPALLLSIPGIVLFVLLPAILLLALLLPLAVVAVPPILLVRWLSGRRRHHHTRPSLRLATQG
jgi:hypothetical protein